MDSFLNPENILNQLDLREDMLAAEFGCGSGNFSLSLTRRLPEGKVYALDIQTEVLSALVGRASQERIINLEVIRCDLEKEDGSTLHSDFLDLVLIPNVLFQADEKMAIIKEAERVLKIGGKLLIIDWKKESALGPKQGRISGEEVKKMAEELGLKFEKEIDAGTCHYALLFDRLGISIN